MIYENLHTKSTHAGTYMNENDEKLCVILHEWYMNENEHENRKTEINKLSLYFKGYQNNICLVSIQT